jgi:2-keto-4-pentenoate hydratase/2-oxohepta-3-ene-1,7-dioic acid hydratase in catechol pathway
VKLVRFGAAGEEKPGIIDAAGGIRDVSAHVPDFAGEWLSRAGRDRLAALDLVACPLVEGSVRLGVPVGGTRQFLAIGLNYSDHAAEAGMAVPSEPILFTKAISCLQGANDDVRRPRGSTKMDWEVELAVVIGERASYVSPEDAPAYIAGYTVCDDVSERAFQLERLGTWDKGKGCATFGPVGPWLVTPDEVGDPQDLAMWLNVNGQRMQTGNTATMIFDCAAIVSYVSQFMVLLPGDIITTGTPPGVGMGKQPPVFLKEGDVVELGIDRLGTQRHKVIGWDA